jgi:DNA-binding NtrC family response regulator
MGYLTRVIPLRACPTGLSVLIVDEEASTRDLCVYIALEMGFEVLSAASTELGLALLEQSPVNILITALKVPKLGGLELLKRTRANHPQTAVMVLTQEGTIEAALLQTSPFGAVDCIAKPIRLGEMRTKLDQLVRTLSLCKENRVLQEQLPTPLSYGGMAGASPEMRNMYKLIERVSQHNFPVLILGESGTGKELVARSIHFLGSRQHKPFVPVDCSGLVPTLIETELFGYVKGAFSGAQSSRMGLLESANGGTVFLDEIGDLPFNLQSKLLRVLQEREVRPVGATNRVHIDIRVVAATNRDLETAFRTGGFRQDLYFRLNVVQIKTPALRERKCDIPLLVSVFLEKFSNPHGPVRAISEGAMRRLMMYNWPGNVRELENAMECAVAMGSGPILDIGDLPSNLQLKSGEKLLDIDALMSLTDLKHRAMLRALGETGGDKVAAARLLGIGKTTLYRKLKQCHTESVTH